jgi:vesicle coat complex subunit
MRAVLVSVGIIVLLAGGCGKAKPMLIAGKPVDHWLKQLQDPDAKERKTAIFKLEAAGTSDPAILPALIEMLKDPDAVVRCEAIVAVAKWGSEATGAIATLTEMESDDPSPEVRDYAAKALKKLNAAN